MAQRLQRQYQQDLTELHEQAAEFGKQLKRELIRTPWRPRDKHAFEHILIAVGKPEYNTQLARRGRPWPLSSFYSPPTILTIPRELRHQILSRVLNTAVLRSLHTFFDDLANYQDQAFNTHVIPRCAVLDKDGNIVPELLVTVDAPLSEENKDVWEEYSTSEIEDLGEDFELCKRNWMRIRKIQARQAEPIHAEANKMLNLWPKLSEDIMFCTENALEKFGREKWIIANLAGEERLLRLQALDDPKELIHRHPNTRTSLAIGG